MKENTTAEKPSTTTILKIREIEEQGLAELEQAKKRREDRKIQAKKDAITLIEEAEKQLDTYQKEKISAAEKQFAAEKKTMLEKAAKQADALEKKASAKTEKAAERLYEEFVKEIRKA